jgi:hypothetical protein
MTQWHTDGLAQELRARRRMTRFVAALAVLIMAGTGLANAGSAQTNPRGTSAQVNPPPASDTQGRMQAPVGHRQPRPADLPAGIARDEGARTPEQRALDRTLQICRGC